MESRPWYFIGEQGVRATHVLAAGHAASSTYQHCSELQLQLIGAVSIDVQHLLRGLSYWEAWSRPRTRGPRAGTRLRRGPWGTRQVPTRQRRRRPLPWIPATRAWNASPVTVTTEGGARPCSNARSEFVRDLQLCIQDPSTAQHGSTVFQNERLRVQCGRMAVLPLEGKRLECRHIGLVSSLRHMSVPQRTGRMLRHGSSYEHDSARGSTVARSAHGVSVARRP